MSLFAYVNGSDKANSVRLGEFGLTSKADGSSGFGNIVFDDPTCTLDIHGWQHIVVKETACISAPVLFAGYVAERSVSRSNAETTYPVGTGRFIDTTITDLNTLLQFQAFFTATANRPAETEDDRITWLLGTDHVQGITAGTVNTSSRALDAEDFRQQYPNDVLSSLVNTWIFFVYPDPATGDPLLFYDNANAATNVSTLSISNDLSDITLDANGLVTGTCFPPLRDAVQEWSPSEVYARIGLYWVGGRTIHDNPTTLATFFTPSGLGYRSLPYTTDRVKTEATAISYVDRMLARDSTENETITVTIQLPRASVGLVQAGNRMDTKFVHFGDSDFVARRVTGCEVHQAEGNPELYNVTLELNSKGSDAIGGGGGSPGDFPKPPAPTSLHYYEFAFVFNNNNGGGGGGYGYAGDPAGAGSTTVSSTNPDGAAFYPNTTYNYHLEMTAGTPSELLANTISLDTAETYPPGTTGINLTVGPPNGANYSADGSFTTSSTLTPGTIAQMAAKSQGTGGSMLVTVTGWVDPDGWVTPTDSPPEPGQEVPPETVTMSGADGTTAWPFADGSLRVYQDGFDQTINIASYDGAAGTFTLNYTPDVGRTITVTYQGR